ncbi:hypothetical protein B0H13DRAFT_2048889 [Mycena leptocephala]|nr:hypothetical protein B0H13DRAFT_2048889 [Mycena leptocephala]
MSGRSALPPLDSTLGALEVGGIVSTYLFGIETLQVYHYFRKYPEDSQLLKSTVAAVWIAELGHTISAWHAIYSATVTFYCQPQHLQNPPKSLEMTILFAALIYVLVQGFFANRVRVLSGRWLIPVICWALTILRITCNLAMMVIQWENPNVSTLQVKFRWLMAMALSLGVTVDIVITVSMCYWLWRIRRSNYEPTRKMVDTLLVWSVETGVATTVASVIFLVLFLSRKDLSWFPFFLVQVKLYSNSLLFSLNGREGLRSSTKVLELSSASFAQNTTGRNRGMLVEMSRITETDAVVGKDLERGRSLQD